MGTHPPATFQATPPPPLSQATPPPPLSQASPPPSSTMSGIKLTYFNVRGRAEPARLILAQAGVEYEDARIEREQWAALKTTVPMGQLPCIQVEGKTICQSMAIARYCAKRFGLAGETDLEAALADQAVDAVADLINMFVPVMKEQEADKKAELGKTLKEEKLPAWLNMMEGVLKAQGGSYFSGNDLTWADILMYNLMSNMRSDGHMAVGEVVLGECPLLCSLEKKVGDLPNIKKWVETRPITKM